MFSEAVSVVALWSCVFCTRECATCVIPAFLAVSESILSVTNEITQISADNENPILVWLETGGLGLRALFANELLCDFSQAQLLRCKAEQYQKP